MKKIQLNDGYEALVDDEDYEMLLKFPWRAVVHDDGYVAVECTMTMHELLLSPKVGLLADHADGNSLNNQKRNLRYATHSQNNQNRRKSKSFGGRIPTSSYKGVSWNRSRNKWVARIQHNHRLYSLGYFLFELDAARAYNTAAAKYFGQFARLNEVSA